MPAASSTCMCSTGDWFCSYHTVSSKKPVMCVDLMCFLSAPKCARTRSSCSPRSTFSRSSSLSPMYFSSPSWMESLSRTSQCSEHSSPVTSSTNSSSNSGLSVRCLRVDTLVCPADGARFSLAHFCLLFVCDLS